MEILLYILGAVIVLAIIGLIVGAFFGTVIKNVEDALDEIEKEHNIKY